MKRSEAGMTSMPVNLAGLTHALLCFDKTLRTIVARVRGSKPGWDWLP